MPIYTRSSERLLCITMITRMNDDWNFDQEVISCASDAVAVLGMGLAHPNLQNAKG